MFNNNFKILIIMDLFIKKNLFFIAIVFICCCSVLQAQDIITFRNGDEIKGKVTEITSSEIKYKRFENLDGPTIVVLKSDVFAINYENGTQEVVNAITVPISTPATVAQTSLQPLTYKDGVWLNGKLTPEQVRGIMSDNSEALKLYNNGRSLVVMGYVISYPCAFLLGWDLGSRIFGKGDGTLLTIGVTGTVTGIIIWACGGANIKKSVSLYNSSIMSNTTAYNLNFGVTKSGCVGFTLNF
jgi:hypothetical protein